MLKAESSQHHHMLGSILHHRVPYRYSQQLHVIFFCCVSHDNLWMLCLKCTGWKNSVLHQKMKYFVCCLRDTIQYSVGHILKGIHNIERGILSVARFCYVFPCELRWPAWAVGSCSISQSAGGTSQNITFKTLQQKGRPAL